MKRENIEIEELIADARAEEEVEKEQKAGFRDNLRKQLNEAFRPNENNKVTIGLNEYMALKFKERDLELIINAIIPNVTLNYSNDALRFRDGDDVIDVIKVIYPEVYANLLEDLLAKGDEE